MTAERRALWDRLVGAGIASGPTPADEDTSGAWYVNAMVGISAWLAALFLLVFLGFALPHLQGMSAAILGLVVCAGAIVLLRVARGTVFATQLAVAVSLAGQGLVVVGLGLDHWNSAPTWLLLAAFEGVLIVLAPNTMHRVLSALAAAIAVRMALGSLGAVTLFPALIAAGFVAALTRAERLDAHTSWPPAVATGLALTLLLQVPLALVDGAIFRSLHGAASGAAVPFWVGAAALAAVFIASVVALMRRAGVTPQSRVGVLALAGTVAIAAVAWPVPGVVAAALMLLYAFAAGRPFLQGLAVVGLLEALVHYYYTLQATLLVKSAALFAIGIVLIGARFFMRTSEAASPEADHA